jgi:hypothetical protein
MTQACLPHLEEKMVDSEPAKTVVMVAAIQGRHCLPFLPEINVTYISVNVLLQNEE